MLMVPLTKKQLGKIFLKEKIKVKIIKNLFLKLRIHFEELVGDSTGQAQLKNITKLDLNLPK